MLADRIYVFVQQMLGETDNLQLNFGYPSTWAISEINSVIIASCLCCLSDLAGFRLWNAPHIGL